MSKANRRRKTPPNTRVQKAVDVKLARWDQGAMGPANRIGLVQEDRGETDPNTGKKINPNGVKGVSRYDMMKVYHKRGILSDRAYTAGERLRNAWDETQRSKGVDLADERVDSTSKPDAAIAIMIDRVSRLSRLSRMIAPEDRQIIEAVAYEERPVSHLPKYRAHNHAKGIEHMKAAFERLADKMEGVC